jgi:predicted AlkP superfamily phosphohydrolase/phosphomutase
MLLRTLLSASLASSLFAADVVVLTLFLNPHASLRADGSALALCLFLPYWAAGTLLLYLGALLGTLALAGSRAPRPPIDGLPWFTSLSAVALAAVAALLWGNLWSYRHSIPVEFVRGLLLSASAATGAWLVTVAVACDALLFPRRSRAVSAALVVLAASSAVVLPLAWRPLPGPAPAPVPLATETVQPVRRVTLIGLDGLGPQRLHDGVAAGRLPALGQMVKRGAYGPLATLRPTEGPPIWTTVFTGRLPRDHGIKSFAVYRLRGSATAFEALPKGALIGLLERTGLVERAAVNARSRRRRALWNALNAFGIETGVVRFWGTHPPERVKGFMLSHAFHQPPAGPEHAAEVLHPPDLLNEVWARVVEPTVVPPQLVAEFVDASVPAPGRDWPWRHELVDRALAPDLTYHRAGSVLRAAYDPPFFATYFYGLDVVSHAFLRYAEPDRFGDVRPEEVRRYGRVVDRYAALLDEWVGESLQSLKAGEVVLVVSGYGMEPVSLARRLLTPARGEVPLGGTHANAPDGVLLALGDGVRAGSLVTGASVLDITPTILYLMGLPVARDMEGRVLTEMLDEDFARSHPITYIPSYESLAVTPVVGRPGSEPPAPLPDEP